MARENFMVPGSLDAFMDSDASDCALIKVLKQKVIFCKTVATSQSRTHGAVSQMMVRHQLVMHLAYSLCGRT